MLDNNTLEQSSVVANSTMNRGRGLLGVNSYARDLAFDPLEFLRAQLSKQEHVAWLDLCCGTGKALAQAAQLLHQDNLGSRVLIQGIDLVPLFVEPPQELDFLHLQAASLSVWHPDTRFDLITCVHGLHYIGDKLELLERAASWLKPEGRLLTHLDLSNVLISGAPAPREVLQALRQAGFSYHRSRHILSCQGQKDIRFPYRYLGADDAAGPNFTKQPVVNSCYEPLAVSVPQL